MKLLFLACLTKNKSGNSFGGAEKSIIQLASWIADTQDDMEVYLASVEGDELAFKISENVKFYGSKQYEGKLRSHWHMLVNTWKVIKKVKPDIVVGFWIHPLFYALPMKLFKNISIIYSARNDPATGYGKIARIMRYFVTKSCNGCVFQTHDAMNFFSENVQKKSKVIFNPTYIGYDDYPLPERRRNVIVNVGRLSKQKNQALLIQAFAEIHKKYPYMQLEIYGEGELRGELQRLIDELKLSNCAFLRGTTPDVLDKVYGSKLFVLSSNYEGMPNALIEAMCVGTPVISTDCPCGGARELIDLAGAGKLVKTNNLPEMIYNMNSVLSEGQDGRKLKTICNYLSKDKIFAEWLEFLMGSLSNE
ncbi:glycosyltransferase [Selenomonas ruminantium]|uniref:glycosyltransferase n=1 Tax=Selenomonas ruminantium TaxID=971 RepID=UPI0026F36DE7|nr:glycosyltransferase [Selenomonas ruminantium]